MSSAFETDLRRRPGAGQRVLRAAARIVDYWEHERERHWDGAWDRLVDYDGNARFARAALQALSSLTESPRADAEVCEAARALIERLPVRPTVELEAKHALLEAIAREQA